MSKISPEELLRIKEDYTKYGLIFDNDTLYNPLFDIPSELQEKPHLFYAWLLSKPEYITFICSEILGVNLLPFQAVIIQELWQRKFPMLIGSRGLGKSWILAVYIILRMLLLPNRKIVVAGASFRQSKLIYEYCCQIWNNSGILRDCVNACQGHQGPKGGNDAVYIHIGGSRAIFIPVGMGETIRGLRANDIITDEFKCLRYDTLVETNNGLEKIGDIVNNTKDVKLINKNGEFESPSDFIKTPLTDAYEIIVKNGYSFTCSSTHKVLTSNGWKICKDLTNKDYLIFDNKYIFPESNIKIENLTLDEDLAELLGLLVSEGSVTNKKIFIITTTDLQMVDYIKDKYRYLNPKVYITKKYKDKRGWVCKESYRIVFNNKEFREKLFKLGLDYKRAINKEIPSSILQSPKNIVIAFLKGLFYGDGSVFTFSCVNMQRLGCSYYSVSEKLINQVQVLLWKTGYLSNKQSRKSKISNNLQYLLRLNGKYAFDFIKELNVDKFNSIINNKDFYVTDRDKLGYVYEKNNKFIASIYYNGKDNYIGSFNSLLEANKQIKDFINNKPICLKVKSIKKLDEKEQLYDFTLPDTHSFYGNGFVQHNSHNKEIFENVISGFGAVEDSPQDKVAARLEKEFNILFGIDDFQRKDDQDISNQIVISGTAYYYFNHFAEYWNKWKSIVLSQGDPEKLESLFPNGIEEAFDWRDYSVIRLPYSFLPPGYMDAANIARSKATLHKSLFDMEFGAVFSKDSDGFFKATLIESCIANLKNSIEKKIGLVNFLPKLSGDSTRKYYMGVDTASQVDNFAIVIIEAYQDHRRIVYCWTTNARIFKEAKKTKSIEETDFFRYCSRKIRDLLSKFSIDTIAIDSQGGGRTIYESLHDKNSLKPGEQMIWEKHEPGVIKDTDQEEGLHIVEMVNFAKQEYMSSSNHGLKKDFEDKICLFPEYNPAILAAYSNLGFGYAEEMEDCIEDIEELKKELTQIVVTTTANGRERFDTPEVKISGSEKSRARKDRYSALLMANMSCRTDYHEENDYSSRSIEQMANRSMERRDVDIIGPAWLVDRYKGMYD